VRNSIQTRMSLTDAWNGYVQGQDHADNLPKNSRPTDGAATLKARRLMLDSFIHLSTCLSTWLPGVPVGPPRQMLK